MRCFEERAAGGGKPDMLHFFHPSTAHALMDSVMFAVDGKQRFRLLAGFGGDELSGGDQTFFVGEPEGLAGFHRFVGGFQAGDADDRTHDKIHFRVSGNPHGSSGAVDHFDLAQFLSLEALAEGVGIGIAGDGQDTP